MKKILAVCFLSLPLLVFTQEYKSAFGVKIGYPGFVGLNGKVFMGKWLALDNLAGVNFDSNIPETRLSEILPVKKADELFMLDPVAS